MLNHNIYFLPKICFLHDFSTPYFKNNSNCFICFFFSFQEEGLIIDQLRLNEEMKLNLDCSNSFKNGGSENCTLKSALRLQAINLPLESKVPEISALQVHLDEFQKILWKERE